MRRRVAILCILGGCVLSGCRLFARPTPTPTPPPVQVSFIYPSQLLTAHYERLAAEFEKQNPRVDIVLRVGSPYSALGPGARNVDVAIVDQIILALLAQNGLIRPLDALVQGSPELRLEAFFPGTIDALRWQGQLWALPADADPWILYYNKDLFDARGVSYPTSDWTWLDMLEAAQRLADPLAKPPVYGFIGDINRADFVPLVYQNGGTLVDSLVDPKIPTFTDPAAVEAIEWYVDLALSYGVMPTPTELKQLGGFEAAVSGGRGAMWFVPVSEAGGALWGKEWPFNWGVALEPRNKARMTLITMRAYVLTSSAENPNIAWEWLRFAATHPDSTLGVPALVDAARSQAFLASRRADVAQVALAAMEVGHTFPPATWIDEIGNWLGQAMQEVFSGRLTVAEAMERVQSQAEPLLAGRSGP